jgi:hypothetical protein
MRYGEARGSPMATDDDDTSWVEVDAGERPEEGSKSELERSSSDALAR